MSDYINEYHNVLEKLKEAEANLRNIVELSTNLFYVHTADHVLTYVSPQSQDFFDCEPEEALVEWTNFITDHPINRIALKITQKAIDTGKRQPPYQVECVGKKGRRIWVEVNEIPLVDQGKTVAIVGSLTDITQYKDTEQKLSESEERYRRLYNETPAMLHSIDSDGCLISVSNYWLDTLGYTREEVINRRTTEFLTDESKRYAQDIVLPEFFKTGHCQNIPYQFVKKNGEIIDVLLSAIAEKDDVGSITRSLAVMVDVTEKKKAEREIKLINKELLQRAKELEEANKDLEAFSYSVSHDLRKPLTIINGYVQAIEELEGAGLNENSKKYLQIIMANVIQMDELIDTVLNFSKVKKGSLEIGTINLSETAHAILSELAMNESNRNVTVIIEDGLIVKGDAKLLRVVMENLLENAWKFTRNTSDAMIEFGSKSIDSKRTFFVKDNGVGFDMSKAQTIFSPFVQLSPCDEFSGFGIGLSTVERILSRHGGKVWADSKLGSGATFYFIV